MSLKALEIDPFLLAGMYRQPLIPVIPSSSDHHADHHKKEPTGKTVPATVSFLGNNSRHILLLIRNEEAAYLSEPVFELLGNLLNACKLTMNDVALVNTAHGAGTDASSLLEQFSPEKIIFFGDPLPELSSGQPKNKPWEQGGYTLLLTDPLEEMQHDVQLKVPFWKALQTFFDLKKQRGSMPELVFATHNPHKVIEVRSMLGNGIRIISLDEAGLHDDIPEPYETLEENAREKARTIFSLTKKDCFSEDTGLEVEALDGAPGVLSARYAGPQKAAEDNIALLLERMKGKSNRRARFRTVISLFLGGREFQFEGVCPGTISETVTGKGGFGYDPVFIPKGAEKTFALMTLEEKNGYSHRAKAFKKMADFLEKTQTGAYGKD